MALSPTSGILSFRFFASSKERHGSSFVSALSSKSMATTTSFPSMKVISAHGSVVLATVIGT